MLEVMGDNQIRTARAFGLPERVIVFRYALRLAILPTVTLLGIAFGSLLSGAVFAEIVFTRPGLGRLVYDSVTTRNYPVVQGRSEEHTSELQSLMRISYAVFCLKKKIR